VGIEGLGRINFQRAKRSYAYRKVSAPPLLSWPLKHGRSRDSLATFHLAQHRSAIVLIYSSICYSTHAVRRISTNNFGLLIAYLLPGFTCLWGLSYISETVRSWLGTPPTNAPTVGGFLYITLASIAAGLTVSTVRWAVIDTIHHWTGVPRPKWDFSRLEQNVASFDVLGENHYRYHQFYGGMAIAIPFLYAAKCIADGFWPPPFGWASPGVLFIEVLFLAGSRDTYRKYVYRGNMLLGEKIHAQAPEYRKPSPKQTPPPDA